MVGGLLESCWCNMGTDFVNLALRCCGTMLETSHVEKAMIAVSQFMCPSSDQPARQALHEDEVDVSVFSLDLVRSIKV